MRRHILVMLLGLLLLAPLATAKDVTLPRFAVGDRWAYEIELVDNGALVQTGERVVIVIARGPYTYQGSAREAATLLVYVNMSGDPPMQMEDVRDAATGALLATHSGGQTHTAVEPCVDASYPLAQGRSWTDRCDMGFGLVETTYTVVGGETLTVPAGTFETHTVDAIGTDAMRLWFAQEACGKVAEFSQVNEQRTYVNLTSVRCRDASASPTPPTLVGDQGPTPTPPATPSGTTPAPTSTGATPTGSPAPVATTTGSPARTTSTTDSPGAAPLAILGVVAALAFLARRKGP